MKRNSRNQGIKLLFVFFSISILVAARPSFVLADSDPNQLLSFKKIYIEPAKDNVDGAFQAPIEQSFKDVFSRNPRFELVDNQGQADAVIKTVMQKKATGTDIEIELVLRASEEIFSKDVTTT